MLSLNHLDGRSSGFNRTPCVGIKDEVFGILSKCFLKDRTFKSEIDHFPGSIVSSNWQNETACSALNLSYLFAAALVTLNTTFV